MIAKAKALEAGVETRWAVAQRADARTTAALSVVDETLLDLRARGRVIIVVGKGR
jgi:hypothetical protein